MSSPAAAALEQEAGAAYALETGGMLVGYKNGASYVVIHAIGPGPTAVHTRNRFVPDHAWQSVQVDRIYRQSEGLHRYLGDWHTHPNGVGELSWLDRRTLARIAAGERTGEKAPLMLVGGGIPGAWSWLGHVYTGRRGRLWANTARAPIRIFSESPCGKAQGVITRAERQE